MAKKHELGKKGERLAQAYLQANDYMLLEKNWRYSRAEIDIIAMKEEVLVFIEVKTRTSTFFGRPESFVTSKKKKFMAEAASAYMEEIDHKWEIRFDIIGIIWENEINYELEHYEDAFFPGLS